MEKVSLFFKKEHLHLYLLALILLLGTFFRFYNTPLRYSLMGDTGRDILMAKEAFRQRQLPLTSSFSSLGPFTFGPWYYYILILSHFFIPSVWAPWIAVGFISVSLIIIMYKIGVVLENKWFGLILAGLTAFSPSQISTGTATVQHSLVGPLTALSLYLFLKILLQKPKPSWGIFLGIAIGLAINMHYQSASFLILPLFFLLKKKKRINLATTLLGVFFTALPLLFFELNNHWFNTRNIIRFFLVDQYRLWTPNRWLTYGFKFWPQFWSEVTGLPFVLSFLSIAAFAILFTIQTLRRKNPIVWLLIAVHFCILVVMVRYWRGEKFFGYLQFFHPYIFLFMGYLIRRIFNLQIRFAHFLSIGLLVAVFGFGILNGKKFLKSTFSTVETIKKYNELTENYPGEKFSVYHCHNSNEAMALTLYLDVQQDYDEKRRKIGIEGNCPVVEKQSLSKKPIVKKFPPAGLKIMDLQEATTGALLKAGWQLMSPKVVYNDVARWWFKLQP